jgi:hypothetical protein
LSLAVVTAAITSAASRIIHSIVPWSFAPLPFKVRVGPRTTLTLYVFTPTFPIASPNVHPSSRAPAI